MCVPRGIATTSAHASRKRALSHPLFRVVGMLFPAVCPICCSIGKAPCAECVRALVEPPRLLPPAEVDQLTALTAYEDGGMAMVKAIKFHNQRSAMPWIAEQLANRVGHLRYDAITWMPSSPAGKRDRGYETGKLLAKRVGRLLGVPVAPGLNRLPGDVGQTGRSRHERLSGPALRARRSLTARSVLLVDDVCTTGASLSAAARLLRGVGTEHISAAVIARTP